MNRELLSGAPAGKPQEKNASKSSAAPPAAIAPKSQLYDKTTGVINLQSIGKQHPLNVTTNPPFTTTTPKRSLLANTSDTNDVKNPSKDVIAIKRAMRLFDRGIQKLRMAFQALESAETRDGCMKIILDLGLTCASPTSPYSCKGANCLYLQVSSTSSVGLNNSDNVKTKTRKSMEHLSTAALLDTSSNFSSGISRLQALNTATSVVLEGGHYESLVRSFNPHYLASGRHHHFNATGLRMNIDSPTNLLLKELTKISPSVSSQVGNRGTGKTDSRNGIQNELHQTASLLQKRLMDIVVRPQVLVLEKVTGFLAPELGGKVSGIAGEMFGMVLNRCISLLRKSRLVITDSVSQVQGFSAHTAPASSTSKQASVATKTTHHGAMTTVIDKQSGGGGGGAVKFAQGISSPQFYSSPSMLPILVSKEEALQLCNQFGISLLLLVSYDQPDDNHGSPANQDVSTPTPFVSCHWIGAEVRSSHAFSAVSMQDLPSVVNSFFAPLQSSPSLPSTTHHSTSATNRMTVKETDRVISEITCVFVDSKSSSQANTKGTTLNSRDKRLASASQGIFREKSLASIKEKVISFFSSSVLNAKNEMSSVSVRVGQVGKTSIMIPPSLSVGPNKRVGISYAEPVVFACDIPFSILRDLGTAILSIGLSSGNTVGVTQSTASNSNTNLSSALTRFLTGLEVWRESYPGLKKDIRLLLTELSVSPALAATYLVNPVQSNNTVTTAAMSTLKVYLYSVLDDRFDILVYDPILLGKVVVTEKLLQI